MSQDAPMRIVLGSGSRYRQQLLREMGYDFEVVSPRIDEKAIRLTDPAELALALAHAKADAVVADLQSPALVITADQVVAHAGQIREKPASAEEARRILEDGEPQVLLCDIAMPDEDGYTFVRSLRATAAWRDLPALALTAYASDLDRADATAAGFDRHIAKPVEFEHLVESIEGVLAEKRSTQNA